MTDAGDRVGRSTPNEGETHARQHHQAQLKAYLERCSSRSSWWPASTTAAAAEMRELLTTSRR
jgi:hypothetical protein